MNNYRFPKRKLKELANIYRMARNSAKVRKHSFDLTFDQFLTYWHLSCFYCNTQNKQIGGVWMDRIDNNYGYHVGNVVPCCHKCNTIRGDNLTSEEMKIAMNAVIRYREKSGIES